MNIEQKIKQAIRDVYEKSVNTKVFPDKKGLSSNSLFKVEEYNGFWTREEVAKQTDKVFLFGDNTNDRLNTKYIPSSTQAVIRELPNAIGIDTKKDRKTILNVKDSIGLNSKAVNTSFVFESQGNYSFKIYGIKCKK